MRTSVRKPTPLFLTCFAFICFSSSVIFAQDEQQKFERFSTIDGLPSNVIYSIFQDSKGFIWLGTHEGLCRYDGYSFKVYRNDPASSSSLCANQVNSICEDGDGNIWVGTVNGLCRYNYAKNNFVTFHNSNISRRDFVAKVNQVNRNELMVLLPYSDEAKIKLLNIHDFRVENVYSETGLTKYTAYMQSEGAAIKTNDNRIFIGSQEEFGPKPYKNIIYQFDTVKKALKEFLLIPPNKLKDQEYLNAFSVDKDNSLWVSTNLGALFHFNPSVPSQLIKFQSNQKSEASYAMFADNENHIWIGTRSGLVIYHKTNRSFTIPRFQKLITSIGKTEVTSIFRDNTGIIWIGGFNGLFKLLPPSPFHHITANAESNPKLLSNHVMGIKSIGENKAWVGFLFESKKMNQIDLNKKSVKTIVVEKQINHRQEYFIQNRQVIKLDSVEYWLEKYRKATDADSFMISINPGELMFQLMKDKLNETYPSLNINSIIAFDWNDKEYWLATSKGAIRIKKKTSEITTFLAGPNSINTNTLTSLLMEKNGDVWIGTNGGGLNIFDHQKNKFSYYTNREGLAHNILYSLVKDDKGRLWIGTGNGLSCFDPSTKKFRNFYTADGLANSEFNRYSACKLDNGYLLMGGMSGIDYFHPDSVLKEEKAPPVQITEAKVFDKSIPVVDKMNLSYDENYITLSFSAMDFRNPSANKFAYKLEGIDKDWILSSQNSVSYATLSPGYYHFLVKAAKSDGIWNEIPAEINFTISVPWWKSWWFFSIVGLFSLSALYSIYRFRIYQLKKVFAIRAKISQDLHDEVGATLTSISFLSEVVKKQTGNGESPAHENIKKIGEFSRDMIGEMNDIVWAINPTNDKFEKIEARMQNFASVSLAAKNIQFGFEVDNQLKDLLLGMQQRKNLYLIFKEAVNNAAKYSDCTILSVHISKQDQHILLEITDNGKGFIPENAESKSGGNGLLNMQSRAAEIHAKIFIQSEPGKGTRISLSMPITQNAY
jgi:ligand-binding sensor domain-containing protein/anti-sigma regulatory factor (Ser/Thr protein kinase)